MRFLTSYELIDEAVQLGANYSWVWDHQVTHYVHQGNQRPPNNTKKPVLPAGFILFVHNGSSHVMRRNKAFQKGCFLAL